MTPLVFTIRFERVAYEDAALALARRLFAQFDERIDSLALVPVDDDEFALFLGDTLIRSQRESGQPPRVADVRAVLQADGEY